MRRVWPLLIALGACSSPATSEQRPRDASVDAPVTVTDAPVTVTDAPVTVTDAPVTVTDAPADPVVQLTGRTLTTALQSRLDALFATASVTARRITPSEATADALRGRVIVAAFAAAPTDWDERASVLAEAVRGGAWMLAEVYGAWPLQVAGALEVSESAWSRTPPCLGAFYWLRPAPESAAYPGFADLPAWSSPSPATLDQGVLFASYGANVAPMTVPVFTAVSPTTRARHSFLLYTSSHCEGEVASHPYCLENPSRCDGSGGVGAFDGWVDEFTLGLGRVTIVQTGTHQNGGWRWGDATVRVQAAVLRHALTRVAGR